MGISFQFFGGVNEIGGNKILLADNETKIFLDFGMSFNTRSQYFEEFLNPRTSNGLGDFLSMGLVPDISGVYREDLITHLGRKAEPSEIDAVVLSHAHSDHANYVSFLHKDIPVFCGETCKYILEAVEESGSRDFESEITNFKPRPLLRADYKKPPIQRKFNLFRTGDKFKIGSIEIEPIHVDHSVPGAYGFIIWTSEGPVVYTGDMRLHGYNGRMTQDFINRAKEVKPIALITEGTRINDPKKDESEDNVYLECKNKIIGCKSLVIVNFNFKDVDRFNTFHKIAKETGRALVLNFKNVCFLEKYCQDKKLNMPDSKSDGIFILKPKRASGTYSDEDYSDSFIKCRLDYPNIIMPEDINKNPSKYIIILNFWSFSSLIDLETRGSIFIYSLSEPYNEEMEISFNRMMNWINHFKMNFFQCHCSGHMFSEDLKNTIKSINPKLIFPVHTEHPDLFGQFGIKVIKPEYGTKYNL